MQGLALSRAYYEQHGRPMLEAQFGDVLDRIAAGFAGPGSDRFGFDDDVSRDHECGAGFCLWLTDADYADFGFRLTRAYARLPLIFEGVEKAPVSPRCAARCGVMTIGDFYRPLTGTDGAPQTNEQWLAAPDAALAAAVNGYVFDDPLGAFTAVRETIRTGMPEDVRLKKLAAQTVLAAQSGQYNYARCIAHGEPAAAMLALAEFVRHAGTLIYLLNRRFAPFYKWLLRGMGTLPVLGDLRAPLSALLTDPLPPAEKEALIEQICGAIAAQLRTDGLSRSPSNFLEPHAYEIRQLIRDPALRQLHIMEG